MRTLLLLLKGFPVLTHTNIFPPLDQQTHNVLVLVEKVSWGWDAPTHGYIGTHGISLPLMNTEALAITHVLGGDYELSTLIFPCFV